VAIEDPGLSYTSR